MGPVGWVWGLFFFFCFGFAGFLGFGVCFCGFVGLLGFGGFFFCSFSFPVLLVCWVLEFFFSNFVGLLGFGVSACLFEFLFFAWGDVSVWVSWCPFCFAAAWSYHFLVFWFAKL